MPRLNKKQSWVEKKTGYVKELAEGHPRARADGYTLQHILVAEKALGKHLPEGAVVHHANSNPSDNTPCNLVICQDRAYHNTLHRRIRAKNQTGNPNSVRCGLCRKWGIENINDMVVYRTNRLHCGDRAYHRKCQTLRKRETRRKIKMQTA